MFDDMFTFIDPIVELNEEGTSFVIQAETFFEFLEKAGLDKVAGMPGGAKIEVPLDIVMSLLRPASRIFINPFTYQPCVE